MVDRVEGAEARGGMKTKRVTKRKPAWSKIRKGDRFKDPYDQSVFTADHRHPGGGFWLGAWDGCPGDSFDKVVYARCTYLGNVSKPARKPKPAKTVTIEFDGQQITGAWFDDGTRVPLFATKGQQNEAWWELYTEGRSDQARARRRAMAKGYTHGFFLVRSQYPSVKPARKPKPAEPQPWEAAFSKLQEQINGFGSWQVGVESRLRSKASTDHVDRLANVYDEKQNDVLAQVENLRDLVTAQQAVQRDGAKDVPEPVAPEGYEFCEKGRRVD